MVALKFPPLPLKNHTFTVRATLGPFLLLKKKQDLFLLEQLH